MHRWNACTKHGSNGASGKPTHRNVDRLTSYHQTEELVHCGTPLDTGFWAVRTEHAVFTLDERTNVVERISTVRGMSGKPTHRIGVGPLPGEMLIVGKPPEALTSFSNTGDWLPHVARQVEDGLIADEVALLDVACVFNRRYWRRSSMLPRLAPTMSIHLRVPRHVLACPGRWRRARPRWAHHSVLRFDGPKIQVFHGVSTYVPRFGGRGVECSDGSVF